MDKTRLRLPCTEQAADVISESNKISDVYIHRLITGSVKRSPFSARPQLAIEEVVQYISVNIYINVYKIIYFSQKLVCISILVQSARTLGVCCLPVNEYQIFLECFL